LERTFILKDIFCFLALGKDFYLKDEIDGEGVLLEAEVVHHVLVGGLVTVDVDEQSLALVLLGDLAQDGQLVLECLNMRFRITS
jgi:hypothetical protein